MTRAASAREAVAAAARALADERLVHGAAGNVSARDGEHVAITPTGVPLAGVDATDVAVVAMDGRRLEGPPPSSELALHLGVYRRYEAGAVAHCHAPFATALSTVLDELPCVHYELALLGGPIRVAPYATFGSSELAVGVVAALEGRAAALMANHGAVVLGADPREAVSRTVLLEWISQVYWRAAAVGTPRVLDERALDAAAAAFAAQRSIVDMSG
jgi:L-fuculose-phosphate aldolase